MGPKFEGTHGHRSAVGGSRHKEELGRRPCGEDELPVRAGTNASTHYAHTTCERPVRLVVLPMGCDATLAHTLPEKRIARVDGKDFKEAVECGQRLPTEEELYP